MELFKPFEASSLCQKARLEQQIAEKAALKQASAPTLLTIEPIVKTPPSTTPIDNDVLDLATDDLAISSDSDDDSNTKRLVVVEEEENRLLASPKTGLAGKPLDAQSNTPTTSLRTILLGAAAIESTPPAELRPSVKLTGKSRLNSDFFKPIGPPSRRSTSLNRIIQHDVNRRVQQPFVLPTIAAPPRRVPSPTFAKFNPGLVCSVPLPFGPPPIQLPPPQNVTINNYYGNYQPYHRPSSAHWQPHRQHSHQARQQAIPDLLNLSRSQFRRYCARVSQAEIDYAVNIRREHKHKRNSQ